jgi:hypothetical protein
MYKLFHIFRIDDGPTYDCAHGFVIRARTPSEARSIAADLHGDEGKDLWMDPTQSKCVHLTAWGNIGLVIRDFIHA